MIGSRIPPATPRMRCTRGGPPPPIIRCSRTPPWRTRPPPAGARPVWSPRSREPDSRRAPASWAG
eukprot:73357-Prorocentrum_minimum.AAC.1